jgi:hypothetical protein
MQIFQSTGLVLNRWFGVAAPYNRPNRGGDVRPLCVGGLAALASYSWLPK